MYRREIRLDGLGSQSEGCQNLQGLGFRGLDEISDRKPSLFGEAPTQNSHTTGLTRVIAHRSSPEAEENNMVSGLLKALWCGVSS